MTRTDPSRSARSIVTQRAEFFPSLWPVSAAAIIGFVAGWAYFARLRLANNSVVAPWNELLRAGPLLIAAVLVSAIAFSIVKLHGSELHNLQLTQSNAMLHAKAESADESDERFQLMFHGNPFPAYIYDCGSLRLLDLNEAAADKYGYTLDEFLELSVPDIRPDIDTSALAQELQGRGAGFNHAGVWRQCRKDGSVFFAEATVVRFVRDGREQELVLATDATQRIEAEEALRESRERLRSLVDGAPLGICWGGYMAERFETVNPAFCEMLGYSEEEALNLSLATQVYANPGERANFMEILRRNGRLKGHELTFLKKDGSPIRLRVSAVLTTHDDVNLDRVEAYVEDLTEQGALEQQVRAVQKLEAVGRLAGGVAHDFNNILVVIKLSTEMMLGQITPESSLSKPLLQVSNAADRAAALTKQLLAFSRRQMLQVRVVNINSIVSDTSHMLRRIIGEDVQLGTHLGENLSNAKLDPDQLSQVIMNLGVNARDAMPGGGVLHIETANVELDEAYAKTHPPARPGSYVMLTVSDTGTGIAKADMPRIFDPFFTTKEAGKGTGLGLAIVYGIVKQSGGYIWVYSEPGQGTTFKLYFPTTNSPLEVVPWRADMAGHTTRQTILVVEDEPAIRGNVRDCLHQLGYTVLEADSGEAALELCEQNQGKIELVLTDLIMPGMGGREMARQLAERFPDIEILYTTGYTEDNVARQELLQGGQSFLEKPFSVSELSQAVHRILALQTRRMEARNTKPATPGVA
ncbi:MAG TPA: ATP-binding protein [Terriglobales bacterium]